MPSVQRLIVDNTHTHTLESVLTFSGQLQTATTTNRSSKTLPRCQQVRLPPLVPTGVLCSTRMHVSSSNLQCLQACTIVNSTMFTCMCHRHLYNVYRHRIINTIIQSPDFSRVKFWFYSLPMALTQANLNTAYFMWVLKAIATLSRYYILSVWVSQSHLIFRAYLLFWNL
jgi:hypothetical protein